MKQDLKHILGQEREKDFQLPERHREDFKRKLDQQNQLKKKRFSFLKVASLLALLLTISVVGIVNWSPKKKETSLFAQLKQVEANYLNEIDKEWKQFVAITSDDQLKERFQEKLEALHEEYLELSAQFQSDPNNLLILESLINNLQTRLQLLKDIQEHINLLNQQSEQNENNL